MSSFLQAQIDGNFSYTDGEYESFDPVTVAATAGTVIKLGKKLGEMVKKERKGSDQLISEAIKKIEAKPDEASQIAWARKEIFEAKKFVTEPKSMKLRTAMERARLEAVVVFLQLYLTLRITQQTPFNLNNVKTELNTFDQFAKQFRIDHIKNILDENKSVIDELHNLVKVGSGSVSSTLSKNQKNYTPSTVATTVTANQNTATALPEKYKSFGSWLKSLFGM